MAKKWSEDEIKILEEKGANSSIKELMVLIPNRSRISILRKLTKFNIKKSIKHLEIKSTNRKYTINHNYFNISNLSNRYWVGFIMADGHLTKNYLAISLSIKDKEHLEKFKKDLEYNGPLHFEKNGGNPSVRLLVSSKQIIKDLVQNFGLVIGKKAKSLKPPILLDDDSIAMLIKGYIDGDGWINKNYEGIGVCGPSKEFLEWIKSWFDKWVPHSNKNTHSAKVFSEKCGKLQHWFYKYAINGKRATEIINYLVKLNTPYLDRKWSKYTNPAANFPITIVDALGETKRGEGGFGSTG